MGCRNSILLACCFLAACGTPDDFTRGMAWPAHDTGPAALIVALAPLLAFDVLVKTILTDAGILQREVAVRAAISALIPRLTAANQGLRAAPNAAFEPMVRYAPGSANSDAAAMNATNLGATINIRRWFLARQIATQSAYLGPCRRKERSDCLADPAMRGVARAISGNVRLYRASPGSIRGRSRPPWTRPSRLRRSRPTP